MLFAKNDLSALSRAFAIESGFTESPVVELSFAQPWLKKEQDRFRPGHVSLYPRSEGLGIIASLNDETIYSDATAMNQPMWRLGDVFEIFIGIPGREAYWELHFTPHNHRLQLTWTGDEIASFRRGESPLTDQIIKDGEFLTSATRINRVEGYWQIYVFLPWSSIGLQGGSDLYTLELAFCRYDAEPSGQSPVASSTAAFDKENFHLRERWSPLALIPNDR